MAPPPAADDFSAPDRPWDWCVIGLWFGLPISGLFLLAVESCRR